MIWNFILVFVLGMVVALIVIAKLASGILKVCIPDDVEESPYLYVELGKSIGSICKKKYVLFKVDVKRINTQK